MPRQQIGFIFALLCFTIACSPRDFLTRRLATDLIAGSDTFKTTQVFWLRTGVLSGKDYSSQEYATLRRHGWITGTGVSCPADLAPPCWDVVITPLGVDILRDWVNATAASSQYISVPVAQRSSSVAGCQMASSSACLAAHIAKMMKSSTLRWYCGSIHWSSAVNEVGAALYPKGPEYNSTVGFVRYDDGWRMIEGGALRSNLNLGEALKNAEPAQ